MVNREEAEVSRAPPEPKPHVTQWKQVKADKDKKEEQKQEAELRKKFQVGGPADVPQLEHWTKKKCVGPRAHVCVMI